LAKQTTADDWGLLAEAPKFAASFLGRATAARLQIEEQGLAGAIVLFGTRLASLTLFRKEISASGASGNRARSSHR
jgi:hypothetical protein